MTKTRNRLPSVRVEPELLQLGAVLTEGETMSSFIKEAVQRQVEARLRHAGIERRGKAA
jgi:hypothetical protein